MNNILAALSALLVLAYCALILSTLLFAWSLSCDAYDTRRTGSWRPLVNWTNGRMALYLGVVWLVAVLS